MVAIKVHRSALWLVSRLRYATSYAHRPLISESSPGTTKAMDAVIGTYDYIVIGLGGVGSGALYWLSKRAGANVLGLEQFKIGHDNGGSQDHSRIIRLSYHEEKYTKLTPHTFEAWAEVERESGLKLVYKCGGLDIIRKDGGREEVLQQYMDALSRRNIPFEVLEDKQISDRFPQFNAQGLRAVYQKDGGIVDAARGIAVHVQLARAHGATVLEQCAVTRVRGESDGGATVETTKGAFRCRRVIVTAGAWINQVLNSVGVHIPVLVTQEQVTYYNSPHIRDFMPDRFPIYIFHNEDHDYYGTPIHGNTFPKIGIDAGGPVVTSSTRTFTPDPVREQKCSALLQKYIPKHYAPIAYSKTCLYTMTKDRNFVVDTLKDKGYPQIVFCQGAGHVYKFASLMGKILSEIAVDGNTKYDIAEFTMNRPAITDPSFPVSCFYMGSNEHKQANL